MAKAKKAKKLRGASRMKEQGYKLVNVWLDANEVAVITKAAKLVGRKVATFVREAAFGAAGVVLQMKTDNPAIDEENFEKMLKTPTPPAA